MIEAALYPLAGVVVTAVATLLGVIATQRVAKKVNTRRMAIEEFQAQVASRDAWIAEMDRRVVRLEAALLAERNYVDRLRDWIAAVALPVLARSDKEYPPVPEWIAPSER